MLYISENVLSERIKRIELQNKLMDSFKNPLIFLRVNYPDISRISNISEGIIQKMDMLISDIFNSKVQVRLFRNSVEGPNVLMIINDSIIAIKKMTVQIEDKHILGPCIDIDIYDNRSGERIDRSVLGIEPKRCIVCNDIAERCTILNRHTEEELIKQIQDKYKEFMKSFYGKAI